MFKYLSIGDVTIRVDLEKITRAISHLDEETREQFYKTPFWEECEALEADQGAFLASTVVERWDGTAGDDWLGNRWNQDGPFRTLDFMSFLLENKAISFSHGTRRSQVKLVDAEIEVIDALVKESLLVPGCLADVFPVFSDHGQLLPRYPAIASWLGEQIARAREIVDREKRALQDAAMFSQVLDVNHALKGARATFKEVEGVLDAFSPLLEAALKARDVFLVSWNLLDDVLGILDPSIEILDRLDSWKVLLPRVEKVSSQEDGQEPTSDATGLTLRGASFKGEGLVRQWLCFMVEGGLARVTPRKLSGKARKGARDQVASLLRSSFISLLKERWHDLELVPGDEPGAHQGEKGDLLAFMEGGLDKETRLTSMLSKLVKSTLAWMEIAVMETASRDGVLAGENHLHLLMERLGDGLSTVRRWCEELEGACPPLLASHVVSLRDSLKYQEADLERYSSEIQLRLQERRGQETIDRLDARIKDIFSKIDDLVSRFEKAVSRLLEDKDLGTRKALEVLRGFKKEYSALVGELASITNNSDAFLVHQFLDNIKAFLDEKQRAILLVENLLAVDLREAMKQVARELNEVGSVVTRSTLPGDYQENFKTSLVEETLDLLDSIVKPVEGENPGLDKALLQRCIDAIDGHLVDLEAMKARLLERKERYQYLLLKDEEKADFLEERKIGDCIICYEPVTTLDDEVIVCPHCGRVGHFLCLAWWLENKHICPVCHGQLVTPGYPGE